MADEIERMVNLLEDAERDWPDEPAIDRDGWQRLAFLAAENGMPSAAAGCRAAAGEWPEHRGWFSVSADFDEQVHAIGEKHGFRSPSEHRQVCVSLHLLVRTMPPHVDTSGGVVSAEQGATSWRDLRRKIPGWMSRVRKAAADFLYLLALELHSDDTSFAAASLAGVRKRLTELVMRLETMVAAGEDRNIAADRNEMAAILQSMMTITGPKGGRHSHGKRRQDCVVTAKEFWTEQSGSAPSVVFVPDPITSPASPFAMWFCDVMNYIDGWSVVTCREVLRTRSRKK